VENLSLIILAVTLGFHLVAGVLLAVVFHRRNRRR
jgi:hypothetical protein